MTLREVNRVGEGQKNVPKLRFKGYEDAWEQRMLPDFVEFYNGQTYTPADVQEFGTLVLRSSNIRNGEVIDADNVYINSEKATAEQVKEGDIIVVVRNGSRALIGKHAEIKENMPNTVIGAFMTGLRSGQPSFLNALLETTQFEQEIEKNMGATINQITGYMFSKMSFMTTGENEQEAVGNYFKEIDNLITLHQRKYDALKTMKKTLLSKMFPKDGEDVPEIRFKGFTDAWEQRKLGDIADKVTVKNSNLQYIETFTNSAEVGIISQRDYFDHDIANLSNLDGYYIVQKEDFVYNPRISTSAPVGPINRNKLGRVGVMSPLYTVFRTHNVDTTYLEYFFKSQYWHSFMKFHGDSGARSDRFSIKDAIFFKMPIPLPDIDEQQKIGDYLNSVDHLITLHQRKLDELKNIKKTLLQQMFV